MQADSLPSEPQEQGQIKDSLSVKTFPIGHSCQLWWVYATCESIGEILYSMGVIIMGVGTGQWGFVVGRETRLNSKYKVSKWEFIAKDQGAGQWIRNY